MFHVSHDTSYITRGIVSYDMSCMTRGILLWRKRHVAITMSIIDIIDIIITMSIEICVKEHVSRYM